MLPFFLLGDLILPFLLAPAYRGYNHLTQVMSALGNSKAPLHIIYNIWLVVLGIVILLSGFAIYPLVAEKSALIAAILFIIICAYALGGCILSGIFPVGEGKALDTVSAKIHGFGSVIGFMLLAFEPLFIGLYFLKVTNGLPGVVSLICFVLSLVFFTLFVMSDKAELQGTVIALEGLWQRLSLLCMYLPIIALCSAVRK